MTQKSLAVQWRPTTFDDVVEQGVVRKILRYQLETGTVKNAYLFCGAAGCGKTTMARIFAREINGGKGGLVELDAASNNGVDDVREIIQMAQTRSMDSEYKVFVIDECHMITTAGWNAMLKLIEEPPLRSIFIFCTTDPQKIPKTIMSRVQRYDFSRISVDGIVGRLTRILEDETGEVTEVERSALRYIARLADGCLREAITMLDQCLSYVIGELDIQSVMNTLGVISYKAFMVATETLLVGDVEPALNVIQDEYSRGTDLKQFVKRFLDFTLDVCKVKLVGDIEVTSLPPTDNMKNWLNGVNRDGALELLGVLMRLHRDIRWDPNPRFVIEAQFISFSFARGMR